MSNASIAPCGCRAMIFFFWRTMHKNNGLVLMSQFWKSKRKKMKKRVWVTILRQRAVKLSFQSRKIAISCLESEYALRTGSKPTRISGLHFLKRNIKREKIYRAISRAILHVGLTHITLASWGYHRPQRRLANCCLDFPSTLSAKHSHRYRYISGGVWRRLRDLAFRPIPVGAK